jgi:hypothetical protein
VQIRTKVRNAYQRGIHTDISPFDMKLTLQRDADAWLISRQIESTVPAWEVPRSAISGEKIQVIEAQHMQNLPCHIRIVRSAHTLHYFPTPPSGLLPQEP